MMYSNLLYIEQFSVECCEAITAASQVVRIQGKHVNMICLDLLGQPVAPVIAVGECGSSYVRFSNLLKVKNTTIASSVPLPTYLCHLSPVCHLRHFVFWSASLPLKSSPA